MNHGYKSILLTASAVLVTAAIVCALVIAITPFNPGAVAGEQLAVEIPSDWQAGTWNLFIYVDSASCLTCTEDMDSWRAMEMELSHVGGKLSFCSNALDSGDVARAMTAEGMFGAVITMPDSARKYLGVDELGSPVKILLDGANRVRMIKGRFGNVRESACYFEVMRKSINQEVVIRIPD